MTDKYKRKGKRDLVYGPVHSRRLGSSLGIDPVPCYCCTFDCLYCERGRTKRKVSGPEEIPAGAFPAVDEITSAVREKLNNEEEPDYLTLSGSGEPTLHPDLPLIVEELRSLTEIPLALITNSSLLKEREVFRAAREFDLLVPSLDGGDRQTFAGIDRPSPAFHIEEIVENLSRLQRLKKGRLWLEVTLIKGEGITNADPRSLQNIAAAIERIGPDLVQLNTAVRQPAEDVEKLNRRELQSAARELRQNSEAEVELVREEVERGTT